MDEDLVKIIREMKDRQDIWDCLMRYCRGVDRLDRATLESAYHEDATDDHGNYAGPVAGWVDWILDYLEKNHRRTNHAVCNFTCDIDGDTAHVESYYIYTSTNVDAPHHIQFTGRYVDRFEKRNGQWKIAVRLNVLDTTDERIDPGGLLGDMMYAPSARDRTDPAFQRPLTVDPSRFTQ
jgi:hypothetical protein